MSWIELHNIFNLSWHHSDLNWSQNPQWNLILNVTILDIIHMRPISFGVSHFKEKKIPRESKRVGRYVWHTCDILITLLVHKSDFHTSIQSVCLLIQNIFILIVVTLLNSLKTVFSLKLETQDKIQCIWMMSRIRTFKMTMIVKKDTKSLLKSYPVQWTDSTFI